ncbi:GntR family transcriptional regulator [Occultella glacieicola]|uniref:GntR family transcriptional regulator n=1 Tax=Occultella glacieicola TaxID=2518684 RepID=A0ABY2E3V5_9MICO|nr:GntR family transcriptional regulator [Occultella glacieicola]TDE92795.1 GntR family transcriptional regulator [Occultella glacieicola]
MPVADVTPRRRQSTVEYLADELRSAIMTGRLAQGEQLGEADLADRFAVSRGPLREAMQRLVSEGILLGIRNRGVFVPVLSLEDVADIYRARSVIERGAVELVMKADRGAAYRALGPSVEAMRSAAARGSASAVADADHAFHEALVGCSGSPRLIRAMRTLVVETRMCLGELETTYPELGAQVREHEELRDAVRDGTPTEAKRLLRVHMDDAVRRLVEKRAPSAS